MKINSIHILLFFLFAFYAVKSHANSYISNYTTADFFSKNIANQSLDYEALDEELLSATLYFLIDKKRQRSRKKSWNFSEELSQYAQQKLNEKRGTYFKPNKRRKASILKRIKRSKNLFSRKKTYLDLSFDFVPAISYNSRYKYEYRDEKFYEIRKNYKMKKYAIEAHTYQSLAEAILARISQTGGNRLVSSKIYEEVGIAVQIEQKAPQRMPYVKVFWMVGGYRLARLTER